MKNAGKDSLFAAATDRQGSLMVTMHTASGKVERYSYDPFGRRRSADNWVQDVRTEPRFSRGYCMHEHVSEMDMIDMNGRLYDPTLCQFLSPDPYIQDPTNWQNYNRYGYCLQNPMLYTDPSGEYLLIDDVIAAVVGGSINLAVNAINGNLKGGNVFESIGRGAAAFGAGAVGGLGALYPECAGWIWGGAVVGATNAWLSGANGEGIAVGAVTGVMTSWLGGSVGSACGSMALSLCGTSITSPLLSSLAVGAFTGAVTHVTCGTLVGMITGESLGDAFCNSFDGIALSMGLGMAFSAGSQFKHCLDTKTNFLTGKPKLGVGTQTRPANLIEDNGGSYSVYEGIDPLTGEVKYVGITKRDPQVRWDEHLNSGTERATLKYDLVEGATGLSETNAHIWEQNLIKQYKLNNLYNKVNSIAPKYWPLYNIQP